MSLQTMFYCFREHVKDIGEVHFTLNEYVNFYLHHKVGDEYEMVNRDKSVVTCKVAYYPIPYYKDLRALIEIDGWDFREVPVRFLTKKATS